ncbi:hypothetical protein LPJ66_006921, partial [Kickxella alabastrina]
MSSAHSSSTESASESMLTRRKAAAAPAATTTSPRPHDNVAFEDVTDSNFVYEFGGPIGAASMIVGFPLLMAY